MAKAFLHRAAESAVIGRAVAALEGLEPRRPNLLRVLTYHRVDEREPFARQMAHLVGRYPVVSIHQVLAALDGGDPLPPRAVLLTFDDAYRSFADIAWPVLCSHGFPAALFVPTAYPDSDRTGFWWDRLQRAFACTERRELVTPVGHFPLTTPGERARAQAEVKRFVKDLSHGETLVQSAAICRALGLDDGGHEVLNWEELRALAREGVAVGAHTRTHPRLDRVSLAEAGEEIAGSVRDVEREIPGALRIFAYPDGRFSDEIVELVRRSGVELALTTRQGTNDLRRADRLRLRRVYVDARDSCNVFRARLVYSSARWNRARRLRRPPTPRERDSERSTRAENVRSRLLYRSLDAALTAELRPRRRLLDSLLRVAGPRTPNYERIGTLVKLTAVPLTGERMRGLLLRPKRLPVREPRVSLLGFGSGVTVFRVDGNGKARVLKVYRRTLGRDRSGLWQVARRYRARYRQLSSWFGSLVLPAEFLVLHGPLLARPAVACLQECLQGELVDPLALPEDELLRRLEAAPALQQQFETFARSCLELHARHVFPDLLGRGNVLLVEGERGPCLRLIDYGIFDLRNSTDPSVLPRVELVVQRLQSLLARSGPGVRG